jgi:hypothetical protein
MMMLTKGMLGTADPAKFIPMQRFVESDVFQKIVARNINLVTATSYEHIFTHGNAVLAANPRCNIIALGYNGEHIMDINHQYSFASYPGYLVGYAKKHLLEIADRYRAKSYKATVVNLMGAETASTNAFAGIENFVVNSFRQMEQAGHDIAALKQQCEALLKPGVTMEQVVANADQYLYAPAIQGIQDGSFPLLTSLATAEVTLQVSEQFQEFHIDRKKLVAYEISRFVKTLMAEHFWDQFDETTSSTLLLDVKQLMEQ